MLFENSEKFDKKSSNIIWSYPNSVTYLESSRTSTMEIFYKNSLWLLAVNYLNPHRKCSTEF